MCSNVSTVRVSVCVCVGVRVLVPVEGSYGVKGRYVQENKLDLAKAGAQTLRGVQIGKVTVATLAPPLCSPHRPERAGSGTGI